MRLSPVAVAIIALAALASAAPKKKNVLFVIYDDLRVCQEPFGGDQAVTPNTNALAAKSLILDRAFCQQVSFAAAACRSAADWVLANGLMSSLSLN